MSETTSAATGRCFGIQRVCQVWERSRSALYARRARAHHHRLGAGPARRGPPPRQSDAQLLAAIRTDLARSPFHGEGHRKVHARLRILDGIRVARPRVLRVMRAHGLLSPHRGRQGAAKTHDASALSRNRKRTVWRSGGIARSRSKRSTAESFRTSRPSAPPWPTSWSGTTRPGVSRSLGIKRRSRRARSMSYARRHSTNVCPGNRVRYKWPSGDASPVRARVSSASPGWAFTKRRQNPQDRRTSESLGR